MDAVTIIIPVYNEEEILAKNIKKLIKDLKNSKLKFEVIIADNGSTDSTPEIAKWLSKVYEGCVEYLRFKERGPGNAFKNAVKKAKYSKIIQLDADLSINYKEFILKSTKLLDSYEMAIGSKLTTQNRHLYRKILSAGFIVLSKLLFNLSYSDYSIGAKAYRKEFLLRNIELIDRWTFYPFKLAAIAKKVKEIKVYCFDKRKSKFNLLKEVIYKFYNILKFKLEMLQK